jgi:hypothetical protein
MSSQAGHSISRTVVVLTFVLVAGGLAFAVQAPKPAGITRVAKADQVETCPECYVQPPFNPGFEMPKDMKMAERIDTF